MPVLRAELAADELVGVERLRLFAEELYGDVDAAAVLHQGDSLRIDRKGESYLLTLPLPFVERDDLEVGRRDGELLVRVGAHRRAVVLPDSLRKRAVATAALRDDCLEVVFQ